eukprot:jgi/Mesvir1/5839/Mv00633-RA.1
MGHYMQATEASASLAEAVASREKALFLLQDEQRKREQSNDMLEAVSAFYKWRLYNVRGSFRKQLAGILLKIEEEGARAEEVKLKARALEEKNGRLEAELHNCQEELQVATLEAAEARRESESATAQLRGVEAILLEAESKTLQVMSDKDALASELENLTASFTRSQVLAETDKAVLTEKVEDLQRQRVEGMAELKRLLTQLAIKDEAHVKLSEDYDKVKAKLCCLAEQLAAAKAETVALAGKHREENERVLADVRETRSRLQAKEVEATALATRAAALETERDALRADKAEGRHALATAQGEARDARTMLVEAQRQLAAARDEAQAAAAAAARDMAALKDDMARMREASADEQARVLMARVDELMGQLAQEREARGAVERDLQAHIASAQHNDARVNISLASRGRRPTRQRRTAEDDEVADDEDAARGGAGLDAEQARWALLERSFLRWRLGATLERWREPVIAARGATAAVEMWRQGGEDERGDVASMRQQAAKSQQKIDVLLAWMPAPVTAPRAAPTALEACLASVGGAATFPHAASSGKRLLLALTWLRWWRGRAAGVWARERWAILVGRAVQQEKDAGTWGRFQPSYLIGAAHARDRAAKARAFMARPARPVSDARVKAVAFGAWRSAARVKNAWDAVQAAARHADRISAALPWWINHVEQRRRFERCFLRWRLYTLGCRYRHPPHAHRRSYSWDRGRELGRERGVSKRSRSHSLSRHRAAWDEATSSMTSSDTSGSSDSGGYSPRGGSARRDPRGRPVARSKYHRVAKSGQSTPGKDASASAALERSLKDLQASMAGELHALRKQLTETQQKAPRLKKAVKKPKKKKKMVKKSMSQRPRSAPPGFAPQLEHTVAQGVDLLHRIQQDIRSLDRAPGVTYIMPPGGREDAAPASTVPASNGTAAAPANGGQPAQSDFLRDRQQQSAATPDAPASNHHDAPASLQPGSKGRALSAQPRARAVSGGPATLGATGRDMGRASASSQVSHLLPKPGDPEAIAAVARAASRGIYIRPSSSGQGGRAVLPLPQRRAPPPSGGHTLSPILEERSQARDDSIERSGNMAIPDARLGDPGLPVWQKKAGGAEREGTGANASGYADGAEDRPRPGLSVRAEPPLESGYSPGQGEPAVWLPAQRIPRVALLPRSRAAGGKQCGCGSVHAEVFYTRPGTGVWSPDSCPGM